MRTRRAGLRCGDSSAARGQGGSKLVRDCSLSAVVTMVDVGVLVAVSLSELCYSSATGIEDFVFELHIKW